MRLLAVETSHLPCAASCCSTPVGAMTVAWPLYASRSHGKVVAASHQARPSHRIGRRGRCRRNAMRSGLQIGRIGLSISTTRRTHRRASALTRRGGPPSVVNLVRCGRGGSWRRHLYRDVRRGRMGRRTAATRGGGLSVAQRGGEALDDRCRRLHFGNRPHALARVHRHRLDVALHARERQVGRVTRYAAGNLLTLLWALA